MALSPSSAPASPLPRQLLRHVSSQLVAAVNRPAPAISLPSAPRGVDAAAAAASHQRVRAASRGAPHPKGRLGALRPGSGGQVHAAPAMATTAPGMVMREPAPPGGLPAQGSSGITHVAPATTAAAAGVAMGGPVPSGLPVPAQGSGEKVDAALAAASSSLAVRRPNPSSTPIEGSGGGGGIINAAVAAVDS